MPASSNAIAEILEGAGVQVDTVAPARVEFNTNAHRYRGADGSDRLHLAMNILDEGRFVTLIAPFAFCLDGPHRGAAIETCLRFQWAFRLARLEYDHRDGELRPAIHLNVLDGQLTSDQVLQTVGALCATCDKLYEILPRVLRDGVVPDFAGQPLNRRAEIALRLAEFTPEQIDLLFTALVCPWPCQSPRWWPRKVLAVVSR